MSEIDQPTDEVKQAATSQPLRIGFMGKDAWGEILPKDENDPCNESRKLRIGYMGVFSDSQ